MKTVPAFRTHRKITGMSAILLPMQSPHDVDWGGFERHLVRTWEAGLVPAVNMDTGFANLIDEATRTEALQRTQALAHGRKYVAGAFVGDKPGASYDRDAYMRQIEQVQRYGGLPILFQSFGLTSQSDSDLIAGYADIGKQCGDFLAFELGTMFAPFGKIYSLDVYRELVKIPQCLGAKHSSLDRNQEWERIEVRDATRTDFLVLTGNDLAIDMVFYGSDYLLGLSTFAPDLFALRDRWWAEGNAMAIALNDILQYLGFLAFRNPVPAYKHSAAQFLKLRGWLDCDLTFPGSPVRPDSDIEIWKEALELLRPYLS